MVKSMTGFGKGEYDDGKRVITCEIKSVNHRFTDIHTKVPKKYSFAEEAIKSEIKNVLKRGKIDVFLTVDNIEDSDVEITLSTAIAKQYYNNLLALKEELGLKDEITLELIAGMPDVIKNVPDIEEEEEVKKSILKSVKLALENIDEMRIVEGEKLRKDLDMRGDLVADLAKKIAERAPEVGLAYAEKLRQRISELIGDAVEIPQDRILLEAAVFADKANITEELVRLDSHVNQLHTILAGNGESCGKKLDFLIQEMNREANTIGSKANDLGITELMLEIKSEVEKIREQVQNIE